MKAETEIKVGDRVMVQGHGFYMHNAMHDSDGVEIPGLGILMYYTPDPWTGRVVAEMEHNFIVAYEDPAFGSPWPESGYAAHIIEACKAAGLDPTLRIGLANKHTDTITPIPEGFTPITEIKPGAGLLREMFGDEDLGDGFLPPTVPHLPMKRITFKDTPDIFEVKPLPNFSKEPKGIIDPDAIRKFLQDNPLKITLPPKDGDKDPSE